MSCEKTSIGVALSEEDIQFCSELISAIVTQMAEEVIAAFEQIGHVFADAFGIGFQSAVEASEIIATAFREADAVSKVENRGTPPKKYGMSLRRCPRRTSVHYNYIPTAPRNLPYMRRAY